MNEWLAIYIAGGVAGVILSLARLIVVRAYAWATKSNVVAKNLRKIDPPAAESFVTKVGAWAVAWGLTFLLSWISVAFELFWGIPVAVLRILREMFSSTPEAIKLLRFPLRNNPAMSAEAVFAHMTALNRLAGQNTLTEPQLMLKLDEVKKRVPSFEPSVAVDQLAALRAVDEDVLLGARQKLREHLRIKFFRGLNHGSVTDDHAEYWVYHEKCDELERRFATQAESTEWAPRSPEYYREKAALDWQHRGMLWRRNDCAIEEFREGSGLSEEPAA